MNNTPETDALVSQFLNGGEIPDISAHARKLERERDEAREHLSAVKHFLNKYIAERDEARKESEYYKERYEQLKDESDKWAEMCGQYKQERDEAKQDATTYRARIVEVTEGMKLAWEQEQIHYDNYITMKKERDEAREAIEEEKKWHHKTHKELIEAQCKLLDIEYDKLKS